MKKLVLILLIIGVLVIISITFFMFTTTLSSPTTMTLSIPKDSGKDSVDKFGHTKKKLTLILLKDGKVFAYFGDLISGGKIVSSGDTDDLILEGWKMFSKDSLVVIIKPTEKATYQETIDILDRMIINNIERYSMKDLVEEEKEFLKIDE